MVYNTEGTLNPNSIERYSTSIHRQNIAINSRVTSFSLTGSESPVTPAVLTVKNLQLNSVEPSSNVDQYLSRVTLLEYLLSQQNYLQFAKFLADCLALVTILSFFFLHLQYIFLCVIFRKIYCIL